MNNQVEIKLELRLNNSVFRCEFDQKWYNLKKTKPFALMALAGVVPTANDQMQMQMTTVIICEDCFNKEKDNDNGLGLQDPSKIVLPNNTRPSFKN